MRGRPIAPLAPATKPSRGERYRREIRRVTLDRLPAMDFRILGPLEVSDGDRQVALGGARQRALLGMLLLHANEVVSSDP